MQFLKKLSTLQIALLYSLGVHAALLTVRFVDPEGFNRVFQDTPLEVILVNSRSGEKPDKAQAIAQASLAGRIRRGLVDVAPGESAGNLDRTVADVLAAHAPRPRRKARRDEPGSDRRHSRDLT